MLSWRAKIKKKNKIHKRIQNTNQNKNIRNQDYRSKGEIENKLKFNKIVKNQD